MELTLAEKHLKKLACLLGIVQGLAYSIMALICIIMYNKGVSDFEVNSYMDSVSYGMYAWFLGYNARAFTDQTLYSTVFTAFAWVYLILSAGWFGVSVDVLIKKGAVLPKYLTAWSHFTLVMSAWDFITVVILGADYHKCMNWADSTGWDYEKIGNQGLCATIVLPVLVIAARGFVLWIVNVSVALIINKIALRLKKGVVMQVQRAQMMQPPVQSLQRPVGYPIQQSMAQPNIYAGQPAHYAQYSSPSPSNFNRNHFEYPGSMPEPDYYNQQPSPGPRKY